MTRSTAARAATLVATVALFAFSVATPAFAEETTCTGTIGAERHDNIRVPDGATCSLQGTHADGSVYVGTGARLTATAATVIGNVQAEGAQDVTVRDTSVGGSVQLVQGGSATVDGNPVGGDVQLFSNNGALVVTDNTIDGNLQCKENATAPTGGGNVVQGNAEDQCAGLTGTPSAGAPGTGTGDGTTGDDGTSDDDSTTGDDAGTDDDTTGDDDSAGSGAAVRAIGRLAGQDRFATAVAISQAAFPSGAAVVYLARADESPDALAAGSLRDGPILLVPSCGELPPVVAAEIRRLAPAQAIALGGPAAVCDAVLAAAAAA